MKKQYKQVSIIGLPKSGSSSLFAYLSQFNCVAPAKLKEISVNDLVKSYQNIKKAKRFYSITSETKFLLNANVDMCLDPSVLSQISEIDPEHRFILLLRDPVARFQSHLIHRKNGEFANLTEQYVDRELLKYLDYERIVSSILKSVSEQSLLIIILEDLTKNPKLELSRIHDFIDLNTYVRHFTQRNKAGQISNPLIKNLIKLNRYFGISGYLPLWLRYRLDNYKNSLRRTNNRIVDQRVIHITHEYKDILETSKKFVTKIRASQ